ncbi:MAG TPA: hypothetical protein VGP64_03580 [Polyangia bacterium]|jgi:hypothetical protein
MRLLNVRLDDKDSRLVQELKERGVSISDLVRGAIRAEARRAPKTEPLDVDALVAEIEGTYPTPPRAKKRRRIDTTNRREVAEFIRGKIRRRA